MLNNERHSGCVECWREQDNGVIPMRFDSFDYLIPKSQVLDPKYPVKIEINASNVCNLKCRICTSYASTKWIAEEKSITELHKKSILISQKKTYLKLPNCCQP